MKAITYYSYGTPTVLQYEEVAIPTIKPNEVLIEVHNASLNPADWHGLLGEPFFIRFMYGLFKPKKNVLGADVSGVVKKVGQAVTQFKPGDEVFGEIGTSGFAEYATANVDLIAHKLKTVSFKDAAALPVAAITAYQAIEDYCTINDRSKVLINGASGGVGHYAT